jgi:hypothetical protein
MEEEISQVAKTKACEGAAWLRDKFGLLAQNPWNQKRYMAPEVLFNLDETESPKTIHDNHEMHHSNTGPDTSAETPPRRTVQGKTKAAASMVDLTGNTRDSASQMSSSSEDDLSSSNERSCFKASNSSRDGMSMAGSR